MSSSKRVPRVTSGAGCELLTAGRPDPPPMRPPPQTRHGALPGGRGNRGPFLPFSPPPAHAKHTHTHAHAHRRARILRPLRSSMQRCSPATQSLLVQRPSCASPVGLSCHAWQVEADDAIWRPRLCLETETTASPCTPVSPSRAPGLHGRKHCWWPQGPRGPGCATKRERARQMGGACAASESGLGAQISAPRARPPVRTLLGGTKRTWRCPDQTEFFPAEHACASLHPAPRRRGATWYTAPRALGNQRACVAHTSPPPGKRSKRPLGAEPPAAQSSLHFCGKPRPALATEGGRLSQASQLLCEL